MSLKLKIATVPIQYITAGLERAEQAGCDPEALIGLTQIPREQLASSTGRVSIDTYVKFMYELILQLKDESCGLAEEPVAPGSFSMLCHASINCHDLAHFIRRCIRFCRLVGSELDLSLSTDGDITKYRINVKSQEDEKKHHLIMTLLVVFHRLSCWVTNQNIILNCVNITRPLPRSAKVYNFIFDTKINFGQECNELVFHTSYLTETISQDQQSLDKFLENPVFNLMSALWKDSSLRSRIQDLIKVDLSKELPSIEEVADKLNYSTATLRRRLKDEGTTYKKIKDDLRRDYAIYELEHGCCIERVAENTGFSDPSSFYRSFKRWTGTTPRSYVKTDEADT